MSTSSSSQNLICSFLELDDVWSDRDHSTLHHSIWAFQNWIMQINTILIEQQRLPETKPPKFVPTFPTPPLPVAIGLLVTEVVEEPAEPALPDGVVLLALAIVDGFWLEVEIMGLLLFLESESYVNAWLYLRSEISFILTSIKAKNQLTSCWPSQTETGNPFWSRYTNGAVYMLGRVSFERRIDSRIPYLLT